MNFVPVCPDARQAVCHNRRIGVRPSLRRSFLGFILFLALPAIVLNGCYFMRGSSGGGETEWNMHARPIDPNAIALVKGYTITAVARGLTFPTGITFDDEGTPYVVESGYSYGEVFTQPKLLRIENDGTVKTIAEGATNGPWTSVFWHKGSFFVAEGGELEGGKILKISRDGRITELVKDLPSMGDHHTNSAIVGPDGYLYFGQGTATNSGIVGEDNARFGWLTRHPSFHDIPCRSVTLTGKNYESENVLKPESKDHVSTGAYSSFGTPTEKGQVVEGRVPCSGAVMRLPLSGGRLELYAWGFRNPFGLAFSPQGQLYVTDNGYDDRGSRPVWGAGDVLWEVKKGAWYGWPDYSAGDPLTQKVFTPPGKKDPGLLLADPPHAEPDPAAIFSVHSSSDGFDFSKNHEFGYEGDAFVAQFGDQSPVVGKVLNPVGFKLVRVNVKSGEIEDFAVNKGSSNGPASLLESGGLERPVAARFNPKGDALYVVDFGVLLMTKKGASPQKQTGVIWRIAKGE